MLPTDWEQSTHSSTTKTVFASQYPESALVSIQPVSELTNYCPVRTLSVSTSRFWSHWTNQFEAGHSLPCTGYELGQPISKLAGRLQNRLGCESGLNIYFHSFVTKAPAVYMYVLQPPKILPFLRTRGENVSVKLQKDYPTSAKSTLQM